MVMAEIFKKIKYWSVRIWQIVQAAVASFGRAGAARGAAGMAYYTLFSFFPLLIVLVTIASFFVSGAEASSRVAQLVISVIPVSQTLVEVNIQRILQLRNSVGIVMLLVLLWSGSNAFSMMVHHITSAWPAGERRTFFEKRLFGLAMVIVIILLLFVLMLSSTVLNINPRVVVTRCVIGLTPTNDSSHPGIVSGGTNTLLTKVRGKRINMLTAIKDSGVLITSPSAIQIHDRLNENTRRRSIDNNTPIAPPSGRNPIMSPRTMTTIEAIV